MQSNEIVAIALGAVVGSLLRYHLTIWAKARLGDRFPYGTFLINLSGCLAMGFFFSLAQRITGYPHQLDLLLRTGLLGSYTTFSTYGWDTLTLGRDRKIGAAFFYGLGSAILGLGALLGGMAIANFKYR